MLTDTHCHLYYDELYNNLSQVIQRANNLDVTRFICVGTNIEDSKKCLSISEDNDNIFASAGVHPHDSKDVSESYIDDIYEIIQYDSMIAIGEIGLDYFRNISAPETQKKIFREQMEIAQDLNYPVIIHNRDSDKDLIEILIQAFEQLTADYPDWKLMIVGDATTEYGMKLKNRYLKKVGKELQLFLQKHVAKLQIFHLIQT